jgi:hypothetical protein
MNRRVKCRYEDPWILEDVLTFKRVQWRGNVAAPTDAPQPALPGPPGKQLCCIPAV